MKKFEYHMVLQTDFNGSSIFRIGEALDEEGEQGWELCGIDWGCLIFKREIPQE